MADNILSDFGINILEEEIDDVIFQTNEFLTDATFTGSQGPFWWLAHFSRFCHLFIINSIGVNSHISTGKNIGCRAVQISGAILHNAMKIAPGIIIFARQAEAR